MPPGSSQRVIKKENYLALIWGSIIIVYVFTHDSWAGLDQRWPFLSPLLIDEAIQKLFEVVEEYLIPVVLLLLLKGFAIIKALPFLISPLLSVYLGVVLPDLQVGQAHISYFAGTRFRLRRWLLELQLLFFQRSWKQIPSLRLRRLLVQLWQRLLLFFFFSKIQN